MRRLVFLFTVCLLPCFADVKDKAALQKESMLHEKPSQPPDSIPVKPSLSDEEIQKRLQDILEATGWFQEPKVIVENGVVFLAGKTKSQEFKSWAGDLAHNTEGVAAVVNKIAVEEPSVWGLQMILHELKGQVRKVGRSLPALIFSSAILLVAWAIARTVYRMVPRLFRVQNKNNALLHEVIARGVAFFVFMLGVYFIAEMADLTTMAVTIISGTGLLGIIVGIAFRDITENFLSSLLLSVQSPFQVGDAIDVVSPSSGYTTSGRVEKITLRVTVLSTPDGSSVEIPNATVYKSNIRNRKATANSKGL